MIVRVPTQSPSRFFEQAPIKLILSLELAAILVRHKSLDVTDCYGRVSAKGGRTWPVFVPANQEAAPAAAASSGLNLPTSAVLLATAGAT
jgi:hypothetical protein